MNGQSAHLRFPAGRERAVRVPHTFALVRGSKLLVVRCNNVLDRFGRAGEEIQRHEEPGINRECSVL